MPSIAETLNAEFEKVEEIPDVPVAPEPEETAESRARDESGRFVAKEAKEPAQEISDPEPKRREPPKSWKPEKRAKWETLDPEVADYIHQREEESNAGVEPLKRVWNVVQPFMPVIQESGRSPEAVVADLLHTAHALKTGDPQSKFQLWMNIGKAYGVPTEQLAQISGGQPQVDPHIAQIMQEVQQVKGVVGSWQQQQEQAVQSQAQGMLSEFAKSHPHFEAVRTTMGALINQGLAPDLDTAYDKALRLHDDLWTQQQAQQREAEEKSRREQADKAAKAARASAVSPRSTTPGAAVTNNGAKDRRSMLVEAVNQYDGRI